MVSWFASLASKWAAFSEVGFDKLGLDPLGVQGKIHKARLEDDEMEKKRKGPRSWRYITWSLTNASKTLSPGLLTQLKVSLILLSGTSSFPLPKAT